MMNLAKLECDRGGCSCHGTARKGAGAIHCPGPGHADGDQDPSLSIFVRGGEQHWDCKVGCGSRELTRALRDRGVLPRGEGGYTSSGNGSNSRTPGLTLAQWAASKALPVEWLKAQGLTEITYEGSKAVRVPYRDIDGNLVTAQYLTKDGKKFKSGSNTCLFGLDHLPTLRDEHHYLVVVEGASDTLTLRYHGFPVLGLPGANNWRDERDAGFVEGFEPLFVLIEPDAGGEAVKKWIAKSTIRDRVHLVTLAGFKDPSEMHVADPDAFKDRFQAALDAAPAWIDVDTSEKAAEAKAAELAAGDLLFERDLVARAGETMAARGYAGDTRPAELGFVIIGGRHLDRPVNLAYVAPSAAGKNEAVRAAAALHPPDAVYSYSASSARALIYEDDEYAHKYVIVEEADSIPDDGPVASAIRAIAEAGAMIYKVTERDEQTGRWHTRTITKPGPTGLITTATKSIAYQLGTRVLEVPISDSEQQTLEIMRIHARRAQGELRDIPEPDAWLGLQRWIALAGEHRVVIPFATALIEMLPASLVRMRRDAAQLLSCIQAVALIHQRQRERGRDGEVVATIDDYATARRLLAPIFDAIATEGVTDAIRETVLAIQEGEEITQADLATRLGLAKGTVSYRVNRALKDGWLSNSESNPRKPKRLSRGSPLPESKPLPTAADVQARFEGSNDIREKYISSPPGDILDDPPVMDAFDEEPEPAPPCVYERHRPSDWRHPTTGRLICGVCHPSPEGIAS